MIQTHFVRLEPPYQVIFCNGQVGVQIGSLIAVEEKRGDKGEYGLVTHTHPVVSYGDNKILDIWSRGKNDIWTSPGDFFQGAVWDKAEVNDVIVLGTLHEGHGMLSEKGFSELAYRTLSSLIQTGESLLGAIYGLHRNLRLLAMAPTFNSFDEIILYVEVNDNYDVHYVYMSDDDSLFQLAIPFGSVNDMMRTAKLQLNEYERLLPKNNYPQWKFHFEYLECIDDEPDNESEIYKEEQKADELTKALTEYYSPENDG